ncbi:UNVERIFIED_CONTAM: hypothetical protein FKN15_048117 [Acipenser sinensis]
MQPPKSYSVGGQRSSRGSLQASPQAPGQTTGVAGARLGPHSRHVLPLLPQRQLRRTVSQPLNIQGEVKSAILHLNREKRHHPRQINNPRALLPQVQCPFHQAHLDYWRSCTTDTWVLTTIQTGYSIQFQHGPPPFWGVTTTTVMNPQDTFYFQLNVLMKLDSIIDNQKEQLSLLRQIAIVSKGVDGVDVEDIISQPMDSLKEAEEMCRKLKEDADFRKKLIIRTNYDLSNN